MRKLYIVKNARDFEKIINYKKFVKNNSFIIYYCNNQLPYDRFGISVSKKLGNAVFRNKYKRKIRSIVDNYKKYYNNCRDYIIIYRRGAENRNFQELENDFFNLMQKIGKGNYNEKNK